MKITLISIDNTIISHGMRSISSYLKSKGHSTQLVFMPTEETNFKNYPKSVLKDLFSLVKDSDLIGISSMAFSYQRGIQIIKYIKQYIAKPIIWGGVHATICPEDCLKYADMVCLGEGEEAVLELVEKMSSSKDYLDTQNFWFRTNGKVIRNSLRPLTGNLDNYPFADYDLDTQIILKNERFFEGKEYFRNNPDQIYTGSILIITARGCPYSCAFCANRFLNDLYKNEGKIIRKRNLSLVLKEIIELKDKFPFARQLWISDDSFFLRDMEELEMFVEEYRDKIDMPFQCNVHPGDVQEDKLELLLKAKLNRIIMGIQTGSESFNRNVYKRLQSTEVVIKATSILNKYHGEMDLPFYQFIISNPYETDNDLIETIQLIRKIPKPFFLEIFNLVFFPGTELYNRALKDKIIQGIKDSGSNLDYYDDLRHLFLKRHNLYLNTLIYCMRGYAVDNIIGIIPTNFIDFLVQKRKSKLARFYLSLIFIVLLTRIIHSKFLRRIFKNTISNFVKKRLLSFSKSLSTNA
ncbi:MAG: hypothetical protein A3G93_15140 [Nitrospinae bacterium RIFCSPLOWO2_12_FULL_45_22]|nr:MAG: hypothetical protein A3G93_15140 [Nitrospinae bacterium RIFCSPLOWO2_12_FULL_45_22]